MKKLSTFNFITINGYLNSTDGDISWHRHGAEENQYAQESLQSGNTLLFGRKTYDMMASYWPTPLAMENDSTIADYMNNANKIVVSHTLKKADWKNTIILSGDIPEKVKSLKASSYSDITILGSGSLVSLLAEHGLIDDYQIMIDPVAIGAGVSLFKGIKHPINLQLTGVKSFKSGIVLLSYKP